MMIASRNRPVARAPQAPLGVGATLAGLRVERILSRRVGRYTLVQAASAQGKRVALKRFDTPAAGDDGVRDRVLSLAQLRERIGEPLLPILGTLDGDDGLPCLAHALPRGETLAELLRAGPLDPRDTVAVLSHVAGALESARALGLPLGELTPEDIFVTGGRPRSALLADYGIARSAQPGCESLSAIEGADYRSPEEVRGRPREAASSVYALACILVECLTGAPPYPYERPLLTLHAHLVEPPPRVSGRRDGLPPAIDEVVASGMNKRPEQRYASPERLMRAAQKALGTKAPIPLPTAARKRAVAKTAAAKARPAAPKPDRPSRRSARPQRGSRRPQRRLVARPAHASIPIAAVLILLSTAGFALGQAGGGSSQSPRPRGPSPEHGALAQRAAYVRTLDGVMQRLSTRRTTARQRLRHAHRPHAQAVQATAIADAYRRARGALPQKPIRGAELLPARLREIEGAYRTMAAAARKGDSHAFRVAGRAVVTLERELDRALHDLQQT